jgi:hypothetical protein
MKHLEGQSTAGRRVTLTRERTPETTDRWHYVITYWKPHGLRPARQRYTSFVDRAEAIYHHFLQDTTDPLRVSRAQQAAPRRSTR